MPVLLNPFKTEKALVRGVFFFFILAVFASELAVMELLTPFLAPLGPYVASIVDALFLILCCAPLIWFALLRPLSKVVESPVALMTKVLSSIFGVQILVMLLLPRLLSFVVPEFFNVLDALLTSLLFAPFLWLLVFRKMVHSDRHRLICDVSSPIKLYVVLIVAIFAIDLLQTIFLPFFLPQANMVSRHVEYAFLTTLFAAPVLWFLVLRPLKRAAEMQRTHSDAVRAQVNDGIATIDCDGAIESLNPAAEMIFGLVAGDIVGKPFSTLLAGGGVVARELIREASVGSNKSSRIHDIAGLRADGSTVEVSVSMSRIVLGDRSQFLAIMRDVSVRKRMEGSLRESEARFRSLSECSPTGIFHADETGRFLYTNKRWHMITGLSFASSLGEGWLEAVHPEDRPPVSSAWKRLVAEGGTFNEEFRFITPQGDTRWVLSEACAVCADTAVSGFVGTTEDITERRRSEQSLRDSLSLLQAAIESTLDGLLVVDSNRKLQICNTKFRDMWGFPQHLLDDGDSHLRLRFIKDQVADPEAFLADVEHLYRNPDLTSLRTICLKDGRVFECYTQPQLQDGIIVGRAWSFRDITARTVAEESLKESSIRFRQIFEQTEDAIIFLKPGTSSIIDLNPTAERLYGYTRGELTEGGISLICRPEDVEWVESVLCGISHNTFTQVDNIVNICRDGSEIITSLHGKVITLQGVEITYCTLRDITERVRLEAEAREIQAKLIQANKMTSLGLLVSGVAHEINNPNTFIMASSELLVRVWSDAVRILKEYHAENGDFQLGGLSFSSLQETSHELFGGIVDGARRINEIVNNLKGFARVDRGVGDRSVDVNRVASTAVTILHHQLMKYTENFHVDLGSDLPLVRGSHQQLEQVVMNLLMNACQALPGKDRGIWLTTSCDPAEDVVIISVRDEGRGMSKDVCRRVLEPFFTTKLDSGGTGLGLSISRSIIKEHHGRLEFESEPGKGTTFTIKLPVMKSQPVQEVP